MNGQDSLSILKEEVEAAVQSLKLGKSPGVDNIPSELVKNGGEEFVKALTALCQLIWEQKKWPKEWTQSLVIPLPKKGNLRQCKNHRMISLISHPSKVVLCFILNCLKSKAEELLSDEQAGFRAGQSTVEQIFNCRVLTEKHLQYQRDLFHNFIYFKKAFNWVWHDGLWHVLRGFSIEKGLIQVIQTIYDLATSAVLLNNQLGEYFQMTIDIKQWCILSPTLFNLFLERIMQETLHNYTTTISIGDKPICNLCFADNINLMTGSNSELQELTNKLVATASAYGMEISTVKSKVMVNSTNNASVSIIMDGEKLEEVSSLKYLGATLTKDGTCKAEICIQIATATAVMARLTRVWKSNISFWTKFKLYKSLVISTLLYGCETWTLLAETERRIQAFENKCLRKLLCISCWEHKTNEYVQNKAESIVGWQEPLLSTVKWQKLAWFGHVTWHNGLCKTVM